VYIDWDLPDPAGKSIEFMRDVRDRIEKLVQEFVSDKSFSLSTIM